MSRRIIASGGLVLLLVLSAAPAKAQKFSDWSAPVNVGPVVNASGNDNCPEISKNGLTLYFARAATRSGLRHGRAWRLLGRCRKAFGADQRAGFGELVPVLVVNGHYLYFVSNRPGGCGGNDMYVSFRRDKSDNFGWETPVDLGCQVDSSQNDVRPYRLRVRTAPSISISAVTGRAESAGWTST